MNKYIRMGITASNLSFGEVNRRFYGRKLPAMSKEIPHRTARGARKNGGQKKMIEILGIDRFGDGIFTLGSGRQTLRKHAYSNILKISPPKTESFQIKTLIFFTFLLKT